ncbi:DUF3800 domain-containing protein [archaeon]|jgi:hypothetical protein|nr:DUF3800 domain-containing protein [archaeon]MBT4352673.1 DUF3800 domain-containing protein [archaeon]MBT4646656.1 DUF3800 domain-containing protein [archaeon]MBT6821894.1 DUF3800 domain-containing protein [archaeon]MBT7392304.1 DUF3800 domain-containing protein [archaeon]
MLKYLYIDESGDLGLKGSKFLIISCIVTKSPAKLDRIIKNMRRNKFRKQLKKAQEIKASKSKSEIIKHMIIKLNDLEDVKMHMIVLEKGKLFSEFLKNNKHKLYNYISGKLAQKIIVNSDDLEVRIDKSKGKQILRDDFNNYFDKKLRDGLSLRKIKIYHSSSHSWSGLQFADILAWSCFQKFEHSDNDFLDLIDLEKREIYHAF